MSSPTDAIAKDTLSPGATAAACDFGIRFRSDSLAAGSLAVIGHGHASPDGGDAVRQPSVPRSPPAAAVARRGR